MSCQHPGTESSQHTLTSECVAWPADLTAEVDGATDADATRLVRPVSDLDPTRLVGAPTPDPEVTRAEVAPATESEATHAVGVPSPAPQEAVTRDVATPDIDSPRPPTPAPRPPERFPLLGVVPTRTRLPWGRQRYRLATGDAKGRAGDCPSRRGSTVATLARAAGLATICVLLVGALVTWLRAPPAPMPQEELPPPQQGPSAVERFVEGIEAFRDGEWEAALAMFQQAARDGEPEPTRYIERIERELTTRDAIAHADACAMRGDLACVASALAAADPGTITYRGKGGALPFLLLAVGESLASPAADAEGTDDHKEDDDSASKLQDAGAGVARSTPPSGRRQPARQQRRDRAKDPSPTADAATQEVVDLVRRAEATHGIRSLALLEEAWARVRQLSGAEALERQVRSRLAVASFEAAGDAQRIGAIARVVHHLQRTVEADPSHDRAQTWLASLRRQAEDFFWDGYSLLERNPTRAKERLEAVRALTKPRDPLHRRATKWLETLEGA